MTPHEMFVTVAASTAGLAAATFCVLYAITPPTMRRWWESVTGVNLMALALCLVFLSAGTVARRLAPGHDAGHLAIGVPYLLVAGVMVWRTVMMWRAKHPTKKGDK